MQMKRLAVLQSKCSFYLYQLKLLKIRSIIAVLSQKNRKNTYCCPTTGVRIAMGVSIRNGAPFQSAPVLALGFGGDGGTRPHLCLYKLFRLFIASQIIQVIRLARQVCALSAN